MSSRSSNESNGRSSKSDSSRNTKPKTKVAGAAARAASNGRGGSSAARGSQGRPEDPLAFEDVVTQLEQADLTELYRFWAGEDPPPAPRPAALRRDVVRWMGEPETLQARLARLGRRHGLVLDLHLNAASYSCTLGELASSKELAYLSRYDLEASLSLLVRRALLYEQPAGRIAMPDARVFVMPPDLGDTIQRQRSAKTRGVFDAFTLRGHLDSIYDDPVRAARTSPRRVRELYKMYSNEAAAVARVERLPEGLRELVKKVVMEFGGILPRSLFDRMETELPHWNGRRWGKILSESLVGTVKQLDLTPYGVQHRGETLIAFNEIALAWLRRVAVPSDPDAPHDEASLGVDLVSNMSRFLSFIIDHNVRFTVRGKIFKTTEKRILQELIPNPGRELERSEILSFIYGFARHAGLIKSTGERTFALTPAGRDWEAQELENKQQALLEYVLEEAGMGGEYFHQLRMRHIFMRLFKRVEPEVWYDIMYLPFLVRNNYLSSFDELAVDESFQSSPGGGHQSLEDLQTMAWNLVTWVRQRLYLLGIVDLGYDADKRPVAMRMTRMGARLLGLEAEDVGAPAIGSVVVTPDFEVVLFRSGDDAALVHDLDRFAHRDKDGPLLHFTISEKTIHRALSEGMALGRIQCTLTENARTPVPQNVLYSIKDWAAQAGLLFLNKKLIVRTDDPDRLKGFVRDPGVRPYVRRTLDEARVQLKSGVSQARMRSLLRDLNYLIESE
ncbi:MAG: hypothetical protein ACI8QZ_001106 [Chlamydiales bacterium]